jgi:predicted HTH domain antitoxin
VRTVGVGRHCPPWDELHGYTYEGGSNRLARCSGLCTNSTDVYIRAGNGCAALCPERVRSAVNGGLEVVQRVKITKNKELPMLETTLNVRVPNNLLNLGLTQEEIQRRVSEWLVFSLFSEGKISSGKAGKLLGLSRLEFIELLKTRGISFINYSEDELKEEIESVRKLKPKAKK